MGILWSVNGSSVILRRAYEHILCSPIEVKHSKRVKAVNFISLVIVICIMILDKSGKSTISEGIGCN